MLSGRATSQNPRSSQGRVSGAPAFSPRALILAGHSHGGYAMETVEITLCGLKVFQGLIICALAHAPWHPHQHKRHEPPHNLFLHALPHVKEIVSAARELPLVKM